MGCHDKLQGFDLMFAVLGYLRHAAYTEPDACFQQVKGGEKLAQKSFFFRKHFKCNLPAA